MLEKITNKNHINNTQNKANNPSFKNRPVEKDHNNSPQGNAFAIKGGSIAGEKITGEFTTHKDLFRKFLKPEDSLASKTLPSLPSKELKKIISTSQEHLNFLNPFTQIIKKNPLTQNESWFNIQYNLIISEKEKVHYPVKFTLGSNEFYMNNIPESFFNHTFKTLEEITLTNCNLPKSLRKLPNLQHAHLQGINITEWPFKYKLKSITLTDCCITNEIRKNLPIYAEKIDLKDAANEIKLANKSITTEEFIKKS